MNTARPAPSRPLRVLGDDIRLLLASANSPARLAAMIVDSAPGNMVPPHTHDTEEECYFVLEGELEVTLGDATTTRRSGEFVHVPPRTVHAFRNATQKPVRFLAWAVGGTIDEFFVAADREVRELPRDFPALQRLMNAHGIRPVGAPADCAPANVSGR